MSGGFLFETAPRIVCEDGAASRLGEIAGSLGVKRLLLVTDRGVVSSGLVEPVTVALEEAGIATAEFSDVAADPPASVVQAAAEAARDFDADGVLGLGGGSPMDTAKLAALIARSGEALEQIYGVSLARGPRLKLILAPTTAGTGSEVTPIAVVTTPAGEKMGVSSALLYPDVAVLDPLLTLGLPPRATAMTGVDAMVHAVEAYTSRRLKNPVSDALAIKALGLLRRSIERACADGSDLDARRDMLQGAMLAGMAFANAPVAAVHALAYPVGGRFHVPHGLSNALVLTPVLKFNLPAAGASYGELAASLGLQPTGAALVDAFDALLETLPMERRLAEVGVGEADLAGLAADAMRVERLLMNNPREVTRGDAEAIYRSVL
jgi:alcohol dehydrogenase class IV